MTISLKLQINADYPASPKLSKMVTRSKAEKPIQKTFLADLAPELISVICSYLSLKDFYRFQRSSKDYYEIEIFNAKTQANCSRILI